MLKTINKWDQRFLELAQHVSSWSRDPSTKVGAVIVDDNKRIISTGFNGFAQGVLDLDYRYNDRNLKYEMIVHGEMNAILFAKQNLTGMTLYTWPFMPCSRCTSMIIQTGIKRIVSVVNDNPRWLENFKLTKTLCGESGVQLDLI